MMRAWLFALHDVRSAIGNDSRERVILSTFRCGFNGVTPANFGEPRYRRAFPDINGGKGAPNGVLGGRALASYHSHTPLQRESAGLSRLRRMTERAGMLQMTPVCALDLGAALRNEYTPGFAAAAGRARMHVYIDRGIGRRDMAPIPDFNGRKRA